MSDVLDVDRYEIDGKDRAVVLGVRELDQDGIAEGDRNWSNLHTVYTHGNGVIAAYANQRPEDDASQSLEHPVGRGPGGRTRTRWRGSSPDGYETRVYFGEKSPTLQHRRQAASGNDVELDLPRGATAESETSRTATTYTGSGGVPVGGIFRKLLYAVKFSEPNFLLSSRVNDELQGPLRPQPAHDGGEGRAVADGRLRPLPGGRRRADPVDPRRLHRHRQVPAVPARVAGDDDRRRAAETTPASRPCRPTRSTTCATR